MKIKVRAILSTGNVDFFEYEASVAPERVFGNLLSEIGRGVWLKNTTGWMVNPQHIVCMRVSEGE